MFNQTTGEILLVKLILDAAGLVSQCFAKEDILTRSNNIFPTEDAIRQKERKEVCGATAR